MRPARPVPYDPRALRRSTSGDINMNQPSPGITGIRLTVWRRGWDSNPCAIARKLISSQPRYDHFDTSPDICRTNELCGKKHYKLSNLKSQVFYPIKLPIASINMLFLVAEILFKKITSLAPVSAAS